jgi:Cu/Ag efflux protein CusF
MKKILVFFMVVLLSISLLSCAASKNKSADKDIDKPGAILTNLTTVTATVEAVDHHSRIVTIRGPQGNVFAVHADERVRNFNQVRVGDKVKAEVLESIALYVQKHDGTMPSVKEGAAVAVAPRGEKPGIAAADTVVITATVEDINYDTRMVTLKGPAGKSRTLRVHEDAPDMKKVKTGDQVVVRYTVAVAITVKKPE